MCWDYFVLVRMCLRIARRLEIFVVFVNEHIMHWGGKFLVVFWHIIITFCIHLVDS